MGFWNLLSEPNSNHCLETTVYRPLGFALHGLRAFDYFSTFFGISGPKGPNDSFKALSPKGPNDSF